MYPVLNAGGLFGGRRRLPKSASPKTGKWARGYKTIAVLAAFPVCPRVSYFSGIALGNEKLFACFAPQRGPSGRVCQGRALPLEQFVLQSRKIAAVFSQEALTKGGFPAIIINTVFIRGEMAERFKALVLKTSDVERHRGFESLSLRQTIGHGEVPKRPKGLPC